MHDSTLRSFMTHCPGSPSTGDGLIGLDGVMVSLLSKLSNEPMPKASFMEATSERCHGSPVSGRAYSGRAPAGQKAGLFDQRYVCVREEGCELVSSFPTATPGGSMLPHCMKCVKRPLGGEQIGRAHQNPLSFTTYSRLILHQVNIQ